MNKTRADNNRSLSQDKFEERAVVEVDEPLRAGAQNLGRKLDDELHAINGVDGLRRYVGSLGCTEHHAAVGGLRFGNRRRTNSDRLGPIERDDIVAAMSRSHSRDEIARIIERRG